MNEDAQEFFIQPGWLELFITHVSSDLQTATINNKQQNIMVIDLDQLYSEVEILYYSFIVKEHWNYIIQ